MNAITGKDTRLVLDIFPIGKSIVEDCAQRAVMEAHYEAEEHGISIKDFDTGSYSEFWESCSGYDFCSNGKHFKALLNHDDLSEIADNNSNKIYQRAMELMVQFQ